MIYSMHLFEGCAVISKSMRQSYPSDSNVLSSNNRALELYKHIHFSKILVFYFIFFSTYNAHPVSHSYRHHFLCGVGLSIFLNKLAVSAKYSARFRVLPCGPQKNYASLGSLCEFHCKPAFQGHGDDIFIFRA